MAPYSVRKRKRIAEHQQNFCPVSTNMSTGEEEQLEQQSGPVSAKKAESLSSPTIFPPFPPLQQRLDIAAHETLLRRLGLWEFLNLDLGEAIREDLINEVLASYNYYPMKFTGESRVKDVSIRLDRTAVANALHLPVKRVAKGESFPVSKDESAFLEKLIWGYLVLRDASVELDSYILGFFEGLKELRLVNADWAGLVWFLMEGELLRAKKLVKCYYASHLQLMLKHQRPEFFDDKVIEGGSLDDSLENETKLLLNLQVSLNPEIPCSVQEDDVMQNKANEDTTFDNAHKVHNLKDDNVVVFEGSGAHTGDSFIAPCLKDNHQPEIEIKDVESASVDLLVAHDDVMKIKGSPGGLDKIENQAVHLGSCQVNRRNKFIYVDEQHKKAKNIDEILDVEMGDNGGMELGLRQSDKEDDAQKLHKFQDDAHKLHKFQVDLNLELPCNEQEDDVVQNKANEATTFDNAHKVYNLKDDDVVVDEGSGAHTGDSFIAPCIPLKDNHQPEFKFKDVESAFVDFLAAHDDVMKFKGSPDGLDKIGNQALHLGSCEGNSGNKFIHEDEQQKKAKNIDEILDVEMGNNGGIELGLRQSDKEDDAQKLHKFQDDEHKLHNFQVSLSLEIPYNEQEDDVMKNKANEATTFDNAHKVHNLKDDDVAADEGSGAHTGDSFIAPCIILKDHHQPEFEFKDVESASVDLLVAHDGVMKNKGSPDGLDKIEDQAVHLGSCQENSGNKFIFEDEQQKKASIDEILNIDLNAAIHSSDEEDDAMQTEGTKAACDTSTDNARTEEDYMVQDEASEGVRDTSTVNACTKENDMVQDEASEGVRDSSTDDARTEEDNKVQDEASEGVHDISTDDARMKENYMVHDEVRETSTDNACTKEDHMVQDESSEGVRETSIDNAPMVLDEGSEALTGAVEKTVNNMNELLGIEMDHNGGTEVGLIQSEKEDDLQKLHEVQNDVPQPDELPETQQVGREVEKRVAEGLTLQQCTTNKLGLDLDLCAENLKVWTARFLNSARRKIEKNQKSNLMLQKKIEEQNHKIQQYELMLQKERQQKVQYEQMLQMERQQKQKSDRKYERELHLTKKVLEDYRRAMNETNNSFAKYRERAQLPEEPLYMPHPDGGGEVLLVSEWKKLEEERVKKAIETMVKDFEAVWSAYMEEEISILNQHCERLEGLEYEVCTMSGRL